MFTLCQLLGFPHPDYLMPYLSARQLYEWQLWMKKYVPRPDRTDKLWAMQLAMYYNAHRGDERAMSVDEFLPYYDKFEEDLTVEDMKRAFGIKE